MSQTVDHDTTLLLVGCPFCDGVEIDVLVVRLSTLCQMEYRMFAHRIGRSPRDVAGVIRHAPLVKGYVSGRNTMILIQLELKSPSEIGKH